MRVLCLVLMCLYGMACISTPVKPTQDPIPMLVSGLAESQMALSVCEMQYMLWQWAIIKGDCQYIEADKVNQETRLIELRKAVKDIANELNRRTVK